MVKLGGEYEVSAVKMVVQGIGFTVSVDGKPCATNVGSGDVECFAKGSSLMIHHPTNQHVRVCDLRVGVAAKASSSAPGKEAENFGLLITNKKRGGNQPQLRFSAALAEPSTTTVISNGARFWGDVTDYWFRMPYGKDQVQLGDWRGYISSSKAGSAISAVMPANHSALQSEALMALFQTSHTVRGQVSHTLRRHPVKKWHLPSRHHTDESLEALKRRILGEGSMPRGWDETAVLLQVHAGKQQTFKDGTAVDPRDDQRQ